MRKINTNVKNFRLANTAHHCRPAMRCKSYKQMYKSMSTMSVPSYDRSTSTNNHIWPTPRRTARGPTRARREGWSTDSSALGCPGCSAGSGRSHPGSICWTGRRCTSHRPGNFPHSSAHHRNLWECIGLSTRIYELPTDILRSKANQHTLQVSSIDAYWRCADTGRELTQLINRTVVNDSKIPTMLVTTGVRTETIIQHPSHLGN